jgi:hypothetical protein
MLDNFPVTMELLKKAEILAQNYPAEKATTLNNLACYYRRLGKLHAAMTCLKKALEIETTILKNTRNAADTHLNICAVLSQLGRHEAALEHAQEALISLQEETMMIENSTLLATNDTTTGSNRPKSSTHAKSPKNAKHANSPKSSKNSKSIEDTTTTGNCTSSSNHLQKETMEAEKAPAKLPLDRVSVICIAYHNIGVEQEFLRDFTNCIISYKKGVSLAEQYLGEDHTITTTLKNSYLAVKRVIVMRGKETATLDAATTQQQPPSPGKAAMRLRTVHGPGSPRGSNPSSPSSKAVAVAGGGGGRGRGEGDKLRFPTPKASPKNKEKSPPKFPAVDTKSNALPPLYNSAISPKADGEERSGLSPDDPFFSPRFNFDSQSKQSPKAQTTAKVETPREATHSGNPTTADASVALTETNEMAVLTNATVDPTSDLPSSLEELAVEEKVQADVHSMSPPSVHIDSHAGKDSVTVAQDEHTSPFATQGTLEITEKAASIVEETTPEALYDQKATTVLEEQMDSKHSTNVEEAEQDLTSQVNVKNVSEPRETESNTTGSDHRAVPVSIEVITSTSNHEQIHSETEVDAPILDEAVGHLVADELSSVVPNTSEAYHVEDQVLSQKKEEVSFVNAELLDPVGTKATNEYEEEVANHKNHDQSFYHEHTYEQSVTQPYTESVEQYDTQMQYTEYTNAEGAQYEHCDHQETEEVAIYDHSQSWYAQHEAHGHGEEITYPSGQYETAEYSEEHHQHQISNENVAVYHQAYDDSSYVQGHYQDPQDSNSSSWDHYTTHHSYYNILPLEHHHDGNGETHQEQIVVEHDDDESTSVSL